ncbi:MAG: potassium channel family protein [Phycisphaerae bacterium]
MKQVAVIGLGQFGMHLARTLVNMGCEVIAIDLNEDRVNDIRDHVHRAIIGDARDFQMLKRALAGKVDEAVVGLGEGNIEPSILCTLNLKRIGIKAIQSTARNDDHAAILHAVGATEVIFPERDSAERLARHVANPDIRDMFSLADDYRIMEVIAPEPIHGKSLQDLSLRQNYDLLVLAVKEKQQERFQFLPNPATIIQPEETLMILGRELDLARFVGLGE